MVILSVRYVHREIYSLFSNWAFRLLFWRLFIFFANFVNFIDFPRQVSSFFLNIQKNFYGAKENRACELEFAHCFLIHLLMQNAKVVYEMSRFFFFSFSDYLISLYINFLPSLNCVYNPWLYFLLHMFIEKYILYSAIGRFVYYSGDFSFFC